MSNVTRLYPGWYYQDYLRKARVDVPLLEWCFRHGLEPFTVECDQANDVPGCGAPRRTTIPFLFEGCVGLVAPACPCGNRYGPFEMRALDGVTRLPSVPPPKTRWRKRRPKVIKLSSRR